MTARTNTYWSERMLSGGWFEAFVVKYGAVGIGLLFGTTAKYALRMAEGRKLTVRIVVIDALLLGMVALLASEAVMRLGATSHTAATVASLFAVSSDRLIRLIRTRFLQRVDAEIRAQAQETIGEVRQAVQAASSGEEIIDRTLKGTLPEHFKTLEPRVHPDELPPRA